MTRCSNSPNDTTAHSRLGPRSANHYHFVALIPEAPTFRRLIRHLHTLTATEANRFDNSQGRKVWFQYWDTELTFEKSYLARLSYVHQNPVEARPGVEGNNLSLLLGRMVREDGESCFP